MEITVKAVASRAVQVTLSAGVPVLTSKSVSQHPELANDYGAPLLPAYSGEVEIDGAYERGQHPELANDYT